MVEAVKKKPMKNMLPIFYLISYERHCSQLNIRPIKILQRTKHVENIMVSNFSYVTFSQKVNIKQDISIFLLRVSL